MTSPLTITQNFTAVAPFIAAQFTGAGGTSPYTFTVLPNGAGGSVGASTGAYTAPAQINADPRREYDIVQVTDARDMTAQARILVGSAVQLFCEILQNQLGLAQGRVYLWDQKIFQPTDSDLYIAVSVMNPKPFGSSNYTDANGNEIQTVSMGATLDVDVISRGPAARDRKEEIILAVASQYSRLQQQVNGFYIARLPAHAGFQNLSEVDGAAIPYRYRISLNVMYKVTKILSSPFYSSFQKPLVTVNQ